MKKFLVCMLFVLSIAGYSFVSATADHYAMEREKATIAGKKIVTLIDKQGGFESKAYKTVIALLEKYKTNFEKKNDERKLTIVSVLKKYILSEYITNFETCKKAGGDIAESYPRQCFLDWLAFTENVDIADKPTSDTLYISPEKCDEVNGSSSVDGNGLDICFVDSTVGCYTIYEPVCGKDGKTYGNDCEAAKANITVTHKGECNIHTQLANPASVYCVDQGGTSKIVNGENGQYGECHLPDGLIIEEWELFRAYHACKEKGGIYQRIGKAQIYQCNLPAKDAGESCTDSSQCDGLCLAETKACSPYTINFGCTAILEDSKEVTICID